MLMEKAREEIVIFGKSLRVCLRGEKEQERLEKGGEQRMRQGEGKERNRKELDGKRRNG